MKKILSLILVCALLLSTAPVLQAAPKTQAKTNFSGLPAFPEDQNRPPADWSTVDWTQSVILPTDQAKYKATSDKLFKEGKLKEITNLQPTAHTMSDDAVMNYYQVPLKVQALVRQYRDKLAEDHSIATTLAQKIQLIDSVIPVASPTQESKEEFPILNINDPSIIPLDNLKIIEQIKDENELKAKFSLNASKLDPETRLKNQFTLKPPAQHKASGKNIPLIEYYDGIRNHLIENSLYYLSQNQNADGSWGYFRQYEITAQIALVLSFYNKIDNDQYFDAVNYLINAEPQNNREKALKARLMVGLGEPYQTLLDDVAAQQNTVDGSFGLDYYYQGDPETTLEVALAFWVAGQITEPPMPAGLYYVVNQIEADGSMHYFEDETANYYLINKTAEYLYPFRSLSVGPEGGQISVQSRIDLLLDYLDSQYNVETETLADTQSVEDELMALYSFQIYDHVPEKQTLIYENVLGKQNGNGSFGESLFGLSAALKTLSQPDLEISSIVGITNLENEKLAQFEITVQNKGYAPSSSAVLHDFVDDFKFCAGYDITDFYLDPQGQMIITMEYPEGATLHMTGETELQYYIEGVNESDYSNNWQADMFNFASATDNTPALPTYYIAQKHSIDNNPVLNIRWAKKTDPKRLYYIVMSRLTGTSEWDFWAIANDWNGVFLGGFAEGATYDVAAGALHLDGVYVTYFWNDITQITMSGNDDLYTGNVNGYVTNHNQPTGNLSVAGYGFFDTSDNEGKVAFENKPNGTSATWVNTSQYEALTNKFPVLNGGNTENVRIFTRLKEDQTPPVITNLYIENVENFTFKNQREKRLHVEGSDNIRLRDADFYYYDPSRGLWIYLGSNEFSGSVSVLEWYVPADILGSGYKIKSIIWDYQNNPSAEVEWGPFTVTDGTLPTGTVTVEGLENNTWLLGETKLITWDIETTAPLSVISRIRLYSGLTFETLASNYDVSQTSLSYTLPLQAGLIGDETYINLEVCDTNDNCNSINSDLFTIADNTEPPQPPWGEPVITEMLFSGYKLGRNLKEVFNPDTSTTEIIYLEEDGWPWEPEGKYRRLIYRKLVNNTWQDPIIIKEYWYQSDQNDEIKFDEMDVHKGPNGDIHIVYQEFIDTDASWGEDYTNAEIRYLHVSNGVKVTDRQVTSNEVGPNRPEVAANSQGQVYITWTGDLNWINFTGITKLHYLEGDGYNSWGSISELTSDHTRYQSFAIDQDNPVLTYTEQYQLKLIKKSGGSWSSPIIINRPDIEKSLLHVYAEDYLRLPSIVQSDPQDSSKYLWLSNIRTETDLDNALTANGFVNKDAILNTWRINEYPYNGGNYRLFARGNNEYDLFYDRGTSHSNYIYSLYYLKFSVNPSNGSRTVYQYTPLAEQNDDEQISNFDVALNNDGNYHIFYSKLKPETYSRFYHLFLDRNKTYFETHVTMLTMSVDQEKVFGTANNNLVTAYFMFQISGISRLIYNVANYDSIIDYRLDNVSPVHGGSGTSPVTRLEWNTTGGSITNYDILLGSGPVGLSPIATDVTSSYYMAEGLTADTLYYWQVVGKYGGNSIYSNIWRFSTDYTNSPPSINVTEPDGVNDNADNTYQIRWTDEDSDDSATIALYYDSNSSGQDGTLIVGSLSEDDETDLYNWNTTSIADGQYYVYAVIDDQMNDPVVDYSNGPVTISHNQSPNIQIVEPNGIDDQADDSFQIRWTDEDPDNDAAISLYYDINNSGQDGTLITGGLSENDAIDAYTWNTTSLAEGSYYVYAIISDGVNSPVTDYSDGPVTVYHNESPIIQVLEPNGVDDTADHDFTITWTDNDPDNNATIDLYYDANNSGEDGTLIIAGLSEDDETDAYEWDTLSLANGTYYVYAVINDHQRDRAVDYSDGPVTVYHNQSPIIQVLEPNGVDDTADHDFTITWTDNDPDNNATIDLYYDANNSGEDGTLIIAGLSEDDETDLYEWNTLGLANGTYYVYAVINDHQRDRAVDYSDGPVTVYHNQPPDIQLTEPDGFKDVANVSYLIKWTDRDEDDDASISLYYSLNPAREDGVLIVSGLSEDDETDAYEWDTSGIHEEQYYLYAVIEDSSHPAVIDYSEYPLTIIHPRVYENAEDGETSGWYVYDAIPSGATITNLYDEDWVSQVIELNGDGWNNGYRLNKEDGSTWDNETQFVVQWSMNYSENFNVYIDVETLEGQKYLRYTPNDYDKLLSPNERNIHHGLGTEAINGEWHTFTRDLLVDLKDGQPNNDLLYVTGFLIRGSGKVDDIHLLDLPPFGLDTDNDNLSDREEVSVYGTNPYKMDTDYDDLSDDVEKAYWDNHPTSSWDADVDSDGLINLIDPDSDNDGYFDGYEVAEGFDPADPLSYAVLTLYENAEDITTNGWYVYDADPPGATITNVYDEDKESQVIELSGSGTSNGYRLNKENGDVWNNREHLVIQWDSKYDSNFTVFIAVETTNPDIWYLRYTPEDSDWLLNGRNVHHGLGVSAQNGSWQTFTRDLTVDLHDALPEVDIISVNGFLIRGSGRVDNISLMDLPPEGLDTDTDGLTDREEVTVYGTNPYKEDTDGDGFDDGQEIAEGFDPTDPSSFPPVTIYEDAEDGTTTGWYIYDTTPPGATITNVYDEDLASRVIELTGNGTNNGYKLRDENDELWHNPSQLVVQWSMKTTNYYTIFIDVETEDGHRYLRYTPIDNDELEASNGTSVHHGLGTDSRDGEWHTFTRDLIIDLHDGQPDNEIIEVNSFMSRGNIRVDDISLMEEIPEGLDSDGDGLTDREELEIYQTHPYKADTDDDGFNDGDEVEQATDPTDPESYPAFTLYEDAEDGTTLGWYIYDTSPPGATITNVYDEDKESQVIELNGNGINNGYRLNKEDANVWNNRKHFVAQWDMKYNSSFTVFIAVETTDPDIWYLRYTPEDYDRLLNGKNVHHGLGASAQNGEWQTFTRDLTVDLHGALPEVDIISVNGFLIRGSGRVDDISLMDLPPEGLDSDNDGLTDREEIEVYFTNPYKEDTDGDGFDDGQEIAEGFDPTDPSSFPPVTIYEDAEDGEITGWYVYDTTPPGATITNVYDEDKESQVIELTGNGTNNGYKLRDENDELWHNPSQLVVQWSMKADQYYTVFIDVETEDGHRYLRYTPVDYDELEISNGTHIHHGLGTDSRDGEWHTFTRDLVADLQEGQPDNEIIEVNSFMSRGSIKVDDISLMAEMP